MRQFWMPLFPAVLAVIAAWTGGALGHSGEAAQEEEANIRQEVERIIKEEPEQAVEAQKLLDALNQPEGSREGRQARNRRERGARRIVNGIPSRSHPAVGALLMGDDPKTAGAWCTGTLVGCDKFLTAAHCIADHPTAASYLVFFQELGFFRVKAIRWASDKYALPYFDLAMLTLEKPVEGIAPMPINMSVRPLNKSIATIVGFGRTGGVRFDYGIKREGSVKTAACSPELAGKQVLCWKFDADLISRGSAQNTCNADSGGGVFMRDNDGARVIEKVFGVVSGGRDKDCVKHDLSYNVDVLQYRDWIETAGEGRLSSTMCGAPLLSNAHHKPLRKVFQLSAVEPKARLTVEIPAGTAALRVGMNAEDDGTGKNEFGFAVSSKPGAANSPDRCVEDGSGRQFAFCRVERPQPGLWTIAVTRKKGEGAVQITALATTQE